MDFEEQLEKAEKSPYPSLVGASVKSADDSPHNNYIHPEKYTGVLKQKGKKKKTLLNTSIGASLDDLISEGALLGSEEDFDKFLDDKGNVLSDAKYTKSDKEEKKETQLRDGNEKPDKEPKGAKEKGRKEELEGHAVIPVIRGLDDSDSASVISPVHSILEKLENYSNPNLSEYQIGHQIADHSQLLDSVKSYDLSRLPTTEDTELRSKTSDFYGASERTQKVQRPNFARRNSAFANREQNTAQVNERDSLHSPYFQTTERSPSRSRARDPLRDSSADRSRSRSRSAMSLAHLARGDTYKSTHGDSPTKYELPADMQVDEEEEDEERRSRKSRPTMGDSLAAAEAGDVPADSVTKEPSLVTSGDYTNFNAESLDSLAYGLDLTLVRSESSRNYLRSISRSRSRKPASSLHHEISEKNDSNTDELTREGALVSDDPYLLVNNLDTMMKQVLLASTERSHPQEKVKEKIPEAEKVEKPKEKESTPEISSENAPEPVSIPPEASNNLIIEPTAGAVEDEKELDTTISESEAEKEEPKKDEEKAAEKDAYEPEPTDPLSIPPEASNNLIAEPNADIVGTEIEEPEKQEEEEKETRESETEKTEPEEIEKAEEQDEAVEKDVVNDVPAEEKVEEAVRQLHAEEAPKVSASDIQVDDFVKESKESSLSAIPNIAQIEELESEAPFESSAEVLEKDAQSQVRTQEAPILTASDIKTGLKVEEDEKEREEKEGNETEVKGAEETEILTAGSDAYPSKDSQVEDKLDEALEDPENATKAEAATSELPKSNVSEAVNTEKSEDSAAEERSAHSEESKNTEPLQSSSENEPEVLEKIEIGVSAEPLESSKKSEPLEDSESTGPLEVSEPIESPEVSETTEALQISKKDVKTGEEEEEIERGKGDTETAEDAEKDETGKEKEVETAEGNDEAEEKEVVESQEEAPAPSALLSILSFAGAVFGAAKEILPGQDNVRNEAATKDAGDDDLDISPEELRKHLESLPVYIFTSLAGGMQIVNRTNRLVTILQANKVKFEYRDLGTDEDAKKLWRRYAQGKTLPGVVRGDDFIGNWEYIDEVNEDYRLHEVLYETL